MEQLRTKPEIGTYLNEQSEKALANRLARIEGHVRSLQEMIHAHRCADEILLQVTAVKAALNKFAAVLLEHELKACMDSCMTGSVDDRLNKVTKVMSTLLKQS